MYIKEHQDICYHKLLRHFRMERGASQSTVAAEVGVSRQTISCWERGKQMPSAENWAQISYVLRIPTALSHMCWMQHA